MAHPQIRFASALGTPHRRSERKLSGAIVCREVSLDLEGIKGLWENVSSPARFLHEFSMDENDISLLASGARTRSSWLTVA